MDWGPWIFWILGWTRVLGFFRFWDGLGSVGFLGWTGVLGFWGGLGSLDFLDFGMGLDLLDFWITWSEMGFVYSS